MLFRWVLSFFGFGIVIIALFGTLAYRISQDAANERESMVVSSVAQRDAETFAKLFSQGIPSEFVINNYTFSPSSSSNLAISILDKQGKFLSFSQLDHYSSLLSKSNLESVVSSTDSTGRFGQSHNYIVWAKRKIENSQYQLIVFLKSLGITESSYQTVSVRLAITGILTLWIAVWAGLIVFSLINRKTELLEAARRKSDEQVRLLLNSTAEAIIGLDELGNCIFCNTSAVQMLGYETVTQLLGLHVSDLLFARPAHSQTTSVKDPLEDIIVNGESQHEVSGEFCRRDGSLFPVEYYGYPIKRQGMYVGAVVTFFDVTQKRQVERDKRKLSQVIEQATDAVFITNPHGKIFYVNPSFEKTTGYRSRDILGKNVSLLLAADQNISFSNELWATVSQGRKFSGVCLIEKKTQERICVQQTVAPLKDNNGQITDVVFTCMDISYQLEQEVKIRSIIQEKQSVENASREKSAFLANMSHELRTPLNAIIGYSEIIADELREENRPDLAQDLVKIHTSGSHLLSIINDILDFSKIEAGKIVIYNEQFRIQDLLQDVVLMINPAMQKNHNEFTCDIPEDLGEMYGDITRVRQCLVNLLSNAAKFTNNGRVSLNVESFSKDDKPWVRFSVTDTGIGISSQQVARLFREFMQAEASTTRRFGGTGLGLTICKRLCSIMGGDIEVTSKLHHGSTFSMELPYGDAHKFSDKEESDNDTSPLVERAEVC